MTLPIPSVETTAPIQQKLHKNKTLQNRYLKGAQGARLGVKGTFTIVLKLIHDSSNQVVRLRLRLRRASASTVPERKEQKEHKKIHH